jgi:hypothetical protein
MAEQILAISNHANMLGGGEHSFYDLITHLPDSLHSLVVVPSEGDLANRFKDRGIRSWSFHFPPCGPGRYTE